MKGVPGMLLGWLPLMVAPFMTVRAAESAPARLEFFEQRIRPMLANECYECHGAKKQKGGLRVDFRDGLLKGGDSGPVIVPGNANRSLLVQSIRHSDPDSAMPKDRPKLSDAVIADFVTWVNEGAVDPRDKPAAEPAGSVAWEATFNARKDWWSFRPVQKPPVPQVKNEGRSQHPVDRFLLAELEKQSLAPAAGADRRTLIRRLTFALTGLPPTPAEVRAFVESTAPDAYDQLVDRLLASPRFGEHWARHWMDLMRFAETHGSEGDPELPNAWRYRDYLIRAFNADVPWDQLIREHLAGDLIRNPRWNKAEAINESLLGLTHLRVVEHGFNPVDTLDEQIKTIDSQIDVVSKAFQGLTTSCARCHDHKFDPISERDYYALHGVFASVRPTQLSIDAPELLRTNRTELIELKERIRDGVAKAWMQAARSLPRRLAEAAGDARETMPGDELHAEIVSLEMQLADLERAGRAAALQTRGVRSAEGKADVATVMPFAAWTFEEDARDVIGDLHGEMRAGAVVRNGRLILDGQSHVRTPPLDRPLREKTLEAWVALANLDQAGGGVLTVESADGATFDSIVFAEKEARRWTVGSDFYRRSKNLAGDRESARPGTLVHVAIVYRGDNSVAFFRNGAAYGAAYTPSGEDATLRTFAAGSARVLLGMRHTGGGSALFSGEIEEARLYDRALSAEELNASFRSGPGLVSADDITRALTAEQREARERLVALVAQRRAELGKRFPNYAKQAAERKQWAARINAAANNSSHPLSLWRELRQASGTASGEGWLSRASRHAEELAQRQRSNAVSFHTAWDCSEGDLKGWFCHGVNPPAAIAPGDFSIEPDGDRLLTGLLPSGVATHPISQKHSGVFASPRFRITNDFISVRVVGGKGAGVRLILDNYPLGQGGIYPAADLNSDAPTWVRIDVSYRKGSMAYLEFATREEVTSRNRAPAGAGGRSFFAVEKVVFHDGKSVPREEVTANSFLLTGAAPASGETIADFIGRRLVEAVVAWSAKSIREEQRVFLDLFLRSGLLPNTLQELPELAPLVSEYRLLEGQIPTARRTPGVWETAPYNAPLLSRGDHLKPLAPVERGYLRLISDKPYRTKQSGRLELANDIASPDNPLTARVMVNRIWHHLFGRGLVATVDNFGRLGEKPSHPELLDFLAARFVERGWSSKEMIRYLVTTHAYQMASDSGEAARQRDPENKLFSHFGVRRLGAEAIRDSLLAVSGRLDTTMFGPGDNALAAAPEQRRRSVYLMVRRNFLSPFLETFDAPRPFSTLGKRETTNVPGQSLALLNDPFVIEQATRWAQGQAGGASEDDRVRSMFEAALARPPREEELAASRIYLADLKREHGAGREALAWRDFAQSLFNLKEFIYIR